MLDQAVTALLGRPVAAGRYVDATFGRGGHTRAILARLPAAAQLLAFDKDPEAVSEAACILDPRFSIRHGSFTQLADLPPASLAGVFMDLGVSSPQLDDGARGFSFQKDGPLDMRMDPGQGISAAEWLASEQRQKIAEVIHEYGEERFAGAIAEAIVAYRRSGQRLATTTQLAQLVAGAVRTRERGRHPATRTFQAIRIFINGELQELGQALNASLKALRPGGKLVVISFHSLEDRMVKRFMRDLSRPEVDRRLPFVEPAPARLRACRRELPQAAEIAKNPRARSAVLRVAERTEAP